MPLLLPLLLCLRHTRSPKGRWPSSLACADMRQIISWVEAEKVALPQVTEFGMADLPKAHDLIQSGQSVGKIVCTTGAVGAE